MISFGAPMSVSAFATTKALSPVSASNGIVAMSDFGSSSMSMPPRWVSVIVGARKRVSSVIEK